MSGYPSSRKTFLSVSSTILPTEQTVPSVSVR